MTPAELLQLRKIRGAFFKNQRISLGITPTQLFSETGIARNTLIRIETGECSWMIDTEIILKDYFIRKHQEAYQTRERELNSAYEKREEKIRVFSQKSISKIQEF